MNGNGYLLDTNAIVQLLKGNKELIAVDLPGAYSMSPFTSESFAGYSYSKSGSGNANGGSNITWQDAFGGRLNKYRRLRGAT